MTHVLLLASAAAGTDLRNPACGDHLWNDNWNARAIAYAVEAHAIVHEDLELRLAACGSETYSVATMKALFKGLSLLEVALAARPDELCDHARDIRYLSRRAPRLARDMDILYSSYLESDCVGCSTGNMDALRSSARELMRSCR